MSYKKSAEEFQLPDIQDSVNLLDQLYAEAFFSKTAELGWAPQSPEGARAMLETAYQLDVVDDTPAAGSGPDPFVDANVKLAHVLNSQGVSTGLNEAAEQQGVENLKQAAWALSSDQDIYKAVLAVKAAEAAAAQPSE